MQRGHFQILALRRLGQGCLGRSHVHYCRSLASPWYPITSRCVGLRLDHGYLAIPGEPTYPSVLGKCSSTKINLLPLETFHCYCFEVGSSLILALADLKLCRPGWLSNSWRDPSASAFQMLGLHVNVTYLAPDYTFVYTVATCI